MTKESRIVQPHDHLSSGVKLSVIIPVYNAEKYLRECLDSVLGQSLREIEVICVDDGSTDASLDILEEYKISDGRIRVLHQEKQNAGVARNVGLENAKGDYLLFLDSDDFYETTLCERTYNAAISNETDIVLFNADRYDTATGKFSKSNYLRRDYLPDKSVFSRKDVPDRLFQVTTPCPWTKLFRREFVLREGLKFQPLRHTNDAFFTLVALAIANKVTCVDEVLVHYRSGQKNNLRDAKTDEPLLFFQAYEAVYAELLNRGVYSELKTTFAEAIVEACIHNLNIVKTPEAQIAIYERMLDESFTKMGALDLPIETYRKRDQVERLHGAKHVVEWHNKLSCKQESDFHVLTDHRPADATPAVSVIISVYNTESWLEECLDSILGQSLKNIEVICVNDGSTDNSQSILLQYANKDKRVAVYAQKNSGAGTARNNGVKVSQGQYLQFIDSDDMLALNALELLYEKAERDALDIVYFNRRAFADSPEYKQHEDSLNSHRTFTYLSEDRVYKGTEVFVQMVQHGEHRSACCFQFFSKNFCINHNLKFPERIIHEDELFTFKSMLSATRSGNISQDLYFYRLRTGSTMRTNISFANAYGYFVTYLGMLRFCQKQDFEESIGAVAYQYSKKMLGSSRSRYAQLKTEEKQAVLSLPSAQRQMFELLVSEFCLEQEKRKLAESGLKRSQADLRKMAKQQDVEIKKLKAQIKSLRGSRTFKAGKTLLWLPRKIKQVFSGLVREK